MLPATAAAGTAERDQGPLGDMCAFDSGNVRGQSPGYNVQGAPASHLCHAAVCCIGDLEAMNGNPFDSELLGEFKCSFQGHLVTVRSSLMAWTVKKLPAVQEMRVQSLGQEDPLEKGMATHSSILVWKIPWSEESGGL